MVCHWGPKYHPDILVDALATNVEDNRSYLYLFMKIKSTPEYDLMFNIY